MSDYLEKLKDPRWQKRRLGVLQRDEFSCQKCNDSTKTLHVHHRLYLPGKEPWDYSDEFLVTLCAPCHEDETENYESAGRELINSLKYRGFFSDDLGAIGSGIELMGMPYPSDVMANAIKHALVTPDLLDLIIDDFIRSTQRKSCAEHLPLSRAVERETTS